MPYFGTRNELRQGRKKVGKLFEVGRGGVDVAGGLFPFNVRGSPGLSG